MSSLSELVTARTRVREPAILVDDSNDGGNVVVGHRLAIEQPLDFLA